MSIYFQSGTKIIITNDDQIKYLFIEDYINTYPENQVLEP